MRRGLSRQRLRVTTGCLTCRARRVKCDERRPVCRNCAKKSRPCHYHARPLETSPDQAHGAAQATSSPGGIQYANTRVPDIEPRSFGVSPGPLETHHGVSITGQTEPVYQNLATSDQDIVDYDPPSPQIHQLDSSAPNLCAILQHTKFATPSHPRIQTSTPQVPATHQQPLEPVSHDPDQRTFYVPDPIHLSPTEVLIFRNYVERVSKWIDSFSHDQPFYQKVPSLALHCPMLLYSCLAASSKQLTRAPQSTELLLPPTPSPVFYYQQALREMSHFLIEPKYSGSDELLASSIILSTYEIFDVAGPSFGSHLAGVASLIRSHQITGAEGGIRGATYWTWYRHEVWVAFQSGRRMFLDERYWRPVEVSGGYEGLSMRDVANRVLFVFGQCVSFYVSWSGTDSTPGGGRGRIQEEEEEANILQARELQEALSDWERKLPTSMRICLRQDQTRPQRERSENEHAVVGRETHQLPALWFAYPESAISHQLYHASKILLSLRTSTFSTNSDPFHTRREQERSRREIFMVANSRIDQTWGLISTQCLYVAGLVTEGVLEREGTLELIEMCQRTTGRQTVCIADQLREFWE